jgi:hypothetical protein
MLSKQYFQLKGESRVLVLEGGKPDRALIVRHFQRLVEVWTKSPPLIRAKLGHQFLRAVNPREYSAWR